MTADGSARITPFPARCGARKSTGDPCRNPAGYGTTHPGYGSCKWHYGNTPAHRTNGARQMIAGEARKVCEAYGIDPKAVTPEQVMLEELARSYMLVNYLESQTEAEAAMWPDWQAVLLQERKHQVAVAKMILDAGVAERQTKLAEEHAQMVGVAVRAILDGLNLSPEQRSIAPTVVRRVMAELPAA